MLDMKNVLGRRAAGKSNAAVNIHGMTRDIRLNDVRNAAVAAASEGKSIGAAAAGLTKIQICGACYTQIGIVDRNGMTAAKNGGAVGRKHGNGDTVVLVRFGQSDILCQLDHIIAGAGSVSVDLAESVCKSNDAIRRVSGICNLKSFSDRIIVLFIDVLHTYRIRTNTPTPPPYFLRMQMRGTGRTSC